MKILGETEVMNMVNGAKFGDSFQTERLVEYFTPSIVAKCKKFSVHGYDREDMMMEGVRTLLRCARSFESGRTSFACYFFRALSNEFNYILRKSYTKEALDIKLCSVSERFYEDEDVLEKVFLEGFRMEISSFMRALSDLERKVIRSIYFFEKNIAETARELGYPFSKVQYIRNSVLKRMKREICLG